MITCEESRKAFSPYLDGELTRAACAALDEHLDLCPLCREALSRTRALVRELSLVARPAPPADLAAAISNAVAVERAARPARPYRSLGERLFQWVEPRLMPYAVGAFYSAVLFIAVFGALRQQLQVLRNLSEAQRLEAGLPYSVTWVDTTKLGRPGEYDVTRSLSPELSAAARAPFAVESPTLNPRGALAALTLTPPSSGERPDDDDMIVVADVYGNGSASLAAVVEPPRNRRMVDELQAALRKNPAFVPASLDQRPQTMRVVFALQKVSVADTSY
jgi:hypothetical protein